MGKLASVARNVALLAGVAMIGFLSLGGDTWVIRMVARRSTRGDSPQIRRRLLAAQTVGVHGVPVLVSGLTSSSDEVVQTSWQSLEELLTTWRHAPADEATRGVLALSAELARQAPAFSPEGRRAAESLLRKIMEWPTPSKPDAAADILEYCHTALRRMPAPPPVRVASFASSPKSAAPPKRSKARRIDPVAKQPPLVQNQRDVPPATAPRPSNLSQSPPSHEQDDMLSFPSWLELPGGGLRWQSENTSPVPKWEPRFPDPNRKERREPKRFSPPPVQRPPELFRPSRPQPLR